MEKLLSIGSVVTEEGSNFVRLKDFGILESDVQEHDPIECSSLSREIHIEEAVDILDFA
jgi:hypothetical protein